MAGMSKALCWDRPRFAASPQDGVSSRQTAAAANETLKTRCWKHGHPGKGRLPPPGWAKAAPCCSTEGDLVGGGQASCSAWTPWCRGAPWLSPMAAISTPRSPPAMSQSPCTV